MTLSRRTFLQSSAAFALMSQSAAAQPRTPTRPNVIWIIGDDVGPDEFGCYGHPTIRTPNIDALAEGGIRFSNAFVTTSSCSPSRASLFTGKYPHSTGAENLHDRLPADQVILPEILGQNGYFTGSVGKFHLGGAARQKLDWFDGNVLSWKGFLAERPQDQPFFLAVGFVDAHRPFDRGCVDPPYTHDEITVPRYLPDIPEVREDLAGFYDEITRMDSVIGNLVDQLEAEGALDNTIIVFLGDNGMPFPRAKTTLYDSGIHTPLVIHWPEGLKQSGVANTLASSVDLAPTILDALEMPIPDDMEGVSLLRTLQQPYREQARDYIYAERNWHDYDDHSRAVRDRRYKYIWNAFPMRPLEQSADSIKTDMFDRIIELRDSNKLTSEQMLLFRSRRAEEELYDLENDPNEFYNLAYEPAYQGVLERMRKQLKQWREETDDIPPSDALPDEFDPETGARIRPPHQNQ